MSEREAAGSDLLLQEIFSSRMRAAVLGHMLPRPHLRFSLTELSRLLEQPISSLQHECYKLERIGVVAGKREGNTRRYSVQTHFALYRPLTSLVTAALGPEVSLKASLESLTGLESAFFAGSLPAAPSSQAARVVLIGDVPLEEIDDVQERAALALNLPADQVETAFYRLDDWLERLRQKSAYALGLLNGSRVDLVGNPEFPAELAGS
ncbi:MAG: hypothetical protein ACRDHN_06385 [Thermomicrobiales bacterium]